MIRVLLADDENLIRSALAQMLDLEDDLEVVAEAATGDRGRRGRPCKRAPTSPCSTCRCPTSTASRSPSSWPSAARLRLRDRHQPRPARLPQAGARQPGCAGSCRRRRRPPRSPQVVRSVHAGGRHVDPELAAEAIAAGDSPLTPREADVLELAADGAPVEEIAAASLAVARHRPQLPLQRDRPSSARPTGTRPCAIGPADGLDLSNPGY